MSAEGLLQAQVKMRAAGVSPAAVDVFSHYYGELEAGATGLIREDTITPLLDPPFLSEVHVDAEAAREAIGETVLIKLNGGLGTSMGMDRAKSLLPVRDGKTFLDLIVQQVRHARSAYGARLPLILMNSFRTHDDSLAALAGHPDIAVEGLPLDFVQNAEPKLLTSDLTPVSWPKDPSLEWCPPGHGDIYTAILASGVLEALLEQGFRYANTSNSDNLGAAPSARAGGVVRGLGRPVRGGAVPAHGGGPQGRSPRRPHGGWAVDPAGHRADRAGGDGLLHRRAPPPVLPHEQPVVRPPGALRRVDLPRSRAGVAVDP